MSEYTGMHIDPSSLSDEFGELLSIVDSMREFYGDGGAYMRLLRYVQSTPHAEAIEAVFEMMQSLDIAPASATRTQQLKDDAKGFVFGCQAHAEARALIASVSNLDLKKDAN